jgi:hypothetical protein
MVASLVNTLLGLWLVSGAVLDPSMVQTRTALMAISAAVIAILGVWATLADYLKWPGIIAIVFGIGLFVFFATGSAAASPDITFWIAFWSGNTIGVVSLWSALYRGPSEGAHSPESTPASQPS